MFIYMQAYTDLLSKNISEVIFEGAISTKEDT
jgi:hypothetical protein